MSNHRRLFVVLICIVFVAVLVVAWYWFHSVGQSQLSPAEQSALVREDFLKKNSENAGSRLTTQQASVVIKKNATTTRSRLTPAEATALYNTKR